ncbi:MAG: gliding motility-associated C-terminal domain-containing protein [Bacteroidota bacterium]
MRILLILFLFFSCHFIFSQDYELVGLIDNKIVTIDQTNGETSLLLEIENIPNGNVLRDLVYQESKKEFYTIVNPTDNPYLAKISLSGKLDTLKTLEPEFATIYTVEAISLYNEEIYFSASLNGGPDENDPYAESLLKINVENEIEFLTEINTEKPFPDIDVLNVTEDRIFIFDGAPPGQNFLAFYELEIDNIKKESYPKNIYNSTYIPIADFSYFNEKLFFVVNRSLYQFNTSIQKVSDINVEGFDSNINFNGLTQYPSCPLPSADLEKEIKVCNQDFIILDVENPNASYLWSDGSTNSTLTVTESGEYEVEITNSCGSRKFNTEVNFGEEPNIEWEEEIQLCNINSYKINAEFSNSRYLWSDGSTNPSLTVNKSGKYEVNVTNSCGSKKYSTIINFQFSPSDVKIEAEPVSCDSYTLSLNRYQKGIKYTWQDTVEDTVYFAKKTDWYKLKASNDCGTKTDSVYVEIPKLSNIIIPNIITPNNDQKNDKFEIDERLQNASISIFNRYGRLVYQNPRYLNDWDSENLNSGHYFYQITLDCGDIYKGWVEVRK